MSITTTSIEPVVTTNGGTGIDRKNQWLAYGHFSGIIGLALIWFAIWTVTCNALVLGHFHYPLFPWALLSTTASTALIGWIFFRRAVHVYSSEDDKIQDARTPTLGFPLLLLAALGIALLAAVLTHRTTSPLPYIGGTIINAFLIWRISKSESSTGVARPFPAIAWRLSALFIVFVALYYFGHRADADDASYVNLAIGAQRTVGAVYQFDTMLGDGALPIWLPEYRFEAYELLAATVSTITGLQPIVIFHLVLPFILLALLTLILMLILAPVAGRDWLAAAFLWIAFLYINEATLGSWGNHGVIRLFQGKAFMVTGLLPLLAALTGRWFRRGQCIDLLGLGIGNVCAVGSSRVDLQACKLEYSIVSPK